MKCNVYCKIIIYYFIKEFGISLLKENLNLIHIDGILLYTGWLEIINTKVNKDNQISNKISDCTIIYQIKLL